MNKSTDVTLASSYFGTKYQRGVAGKGEFSNYTMVTAQQLMVGANIYMDCYRKQVDSFDDKEVLAVQKKSPGFNLEGFPP